MSERLAIIGNARQPFGPRPVDARGLASLIDSSRPVIRFNAIPNQEEPWTGGRTDILYIRAQGRPAMEFARWGIRFEHVEPPDEVISVLDLFPYPRNNHDAYAVYDYTDQQAARFRNCSGLDQGTIAQARAAVHGEGSPLMPSLGFVALVHVLSSERFVGHDKYIAGFGFAGWDGHDWTCERRIVARWIGAGRLKELA